ncbi:MAG TPA: type II secretion system protein GspM [Gemmatimonadaceae bacterium]
MRWSTMSPKDKRAVVIGSSIVLLSLGYVWGVVPYRAALAQTKDQLETAREALAREKATMIARHANPDAQRDADSALIAVSARLFIGRDDAIASSQLAAYLGDVARRSRVLLQDAGTRPSSTSPEGIRTLRVEIRAESDVQGITKFLQSLEGGTKLVRVDRMEISRAPGLEDKNGFETLNIAATVVGFAFLPEPPPRPAPKGGGGQP